MESSERIQWKTQTSSSFYAVLIPAIFAQSPHKIKPESPAEEKAFATQGTCVKFVRSSRSLPGHPTLGIGLPTVGMFANDLGSTF